MLARTAVALRIWSIFVPYSLYLVGTCPVLLAGNEAAFVT